MKILVLFLLVCSLISISGCSTTPGDAALRGGQPTHAAELYKQGAQQGDAIAALKLGLLIDNGSVSQSIYGEAKVWFEKACELGELAGCHNMGVGYENGKSGCVKDLEKAKQYYFKAANLGYMQSQYNLGSFYSNNYFSDDLEGYKWMLIAEKTAKECASTPLCQWVMDDPPGHRNKLSSRLSAEQRSSIEKAVNIWSPHKK